jgi:hypothetical protein
MKYVAIDKLRSDLGNLTNASSLVLKLDLPNLYDMPLQTKSLSKVSS